MSDKIKAFWDSQAALGEKAGTQDTILHQLEVEAIAKYIKDGMRILDVGCGTGQTAIELTRRFPTSWINAIDYSVAMILEARINRPAELKRSLFFYCMDIRPGSERFTMGDFDLIYSKRCLINLPDWPAQKRAIANIWSLLKPGGRYVMCESSQDGLDEINQLRAYLSLPAITRPWHNCYFQDSDIDALRIAVVGEVHLENVDNFSGTYYFLSRVLNAALAAERGEEPAYDAPINKLALRLPAISPIKGQSRIWVWRKLK